jgi:hypothetical protein
MLEDVGLELARFGEGLGFTAQNVLEEGIVIVHGVVPSDWMTPYRFPARVGVVTRTVLVVQGIVSRHVCRANPAAPIGQTPPGVPESLKIQDVADRS